MSRLDRMASLLKQEISSILRVKINDSRIGFISIVDVKVSKDFAHAWIYYSQIGSEEDKKKTRRGLYAAQKFFKQEIGKVIRTKVVPDLHFKYDPSLEKGVEIVNKLNRLTS